MEIVSDNELNTICLELLEVPRYLNNDYYISLQFMYVTGCRTNEIFQDVDKYSIIEGNLFSMHTFKGSAVRYFDINTISSLIVNRVLEGFKPVLYVRHSGVNYYIKQKLYPYPIFNGNSSELSYLFRYNRIKQMKIEGFSNNEITSFFGWTDNMTIFNYLNAELYR